MQMRAGAQHVERKIRLWVVKQERIRLLERPRTARSAAAPEPAKAPRPDAKR